MAHMIVSILRRAGAPMRVAALAAASASCAWAVWPDCYHHYPTVAVGEAASSIA